MSNAGQRISNVSCNDSNTMHQINTNPMEQQNFIRKIPVVCILASRPAFWLSHPFYQHRQEDNMLEWSCVVG